MAGRRYWWRSRRTVIHPSLLWGTLFTRTWRGDSEVQASEWDGKSPIKARQRYPIVRSNNRLWYWHGLPETPHVIVYCRRELSFSAEAQDIQHHNADLATESTHLIHHSRPYVRNSTGTWLLHTRMSISNNNVVTLRSRIHESSWSWNNLLMHYLKRSMWIRMQDIIAFSLVSQSFFSEEVCYLILFSSQRKLCGFIDFQKVDVTFVSKRFWCKICKNQILLQFKDLAHFLQNSASIITQY